MYHSITFLELTGSLNSYNTWYDWHLIPSSRHIIVNPEKVTNYVSIPGRSGTLDFSNYVCTKPIYKDRSGTFEFYVMEVYEKFENVKQKIINSIHAKNMKIIFEDDDKYYYLGRLNVTKWVNEASRPKVTISYTIKPYKFDIATNTRQENDF